MASPVSPAPTKTAKLTSKVKAEAAIVIGTLLAVVNALQLAAVPLPSWTHIVVLVVTTVAASLGIRSQVSPA